MSSTDSTSSTEAVLEARGGLTHTKTLYVGFSFHLSPVCINTLKVVILHNVYCFKYIFMIILMFLSRSRMEGFYIVGRLLIILPQYWSFVKDDKMFLILHQKTSSHQVQ